MSFGKTSIGTLNVPSGPAVTVCLPRPGCHVSSTGAFGGKSVPRATVTKPGVPIAGTATTCGSITRVVTLALLFDELRSKALVTLAPFVIEPAAPSSVTTIVTVAVLFAAMSPRAQVTVGAPKQVPWLGVVVGTARASGSVSRTVTPVALSGPRFVTRSV